MNREANRRWMVYKTPKDKFGRALCHLCGENPGNQQHELVNRAQTPTGSKTRAASYHYTLCSLLCPDCHAIAPRKDVEAKLWQYNFNLWGRGLVLSHLQVITDLLGHRPIVNLPE